MSQISEAIDVHVPVRTAYDQWTMFEEFPRFMEGVERIEQVDDRRMHWVAQIAGQRREWDAEVTEQIPDERVAWTSISGANNAGVVTFHRIEPDVTRVMLQLDFEPEGALETVGDALGMVKMRVKGDLARFKEFIEDRGVETGAWRGEVRAPGTGNDTNVGPEKGFGTEKAFGTEYGTGLGVGAATGLGVGAVAGGGWAPDDLVDGDDDIDALDEPDDALGSMGTGSVDDIELGMDEDGEMTGG